MLAILEANILPMINTTLKYSSIMEKTALLIISWLFGVCLLVWDELFSGGIEFISHLCLAALTLSFPQFLDEMTKLGQGCWFQSRQNHPAQKKRISQILVSQEHYSSYNTKHLYYLEVTKGTHNLCFQNHLADVKLLTIPIYTERSYHSIHKHLKNLIIG